MLMLCECVCESVRVRGIECARGRVVMKRAYVTYVYRNEEKCKIKKMNVVCLYLLHKNHLLVSCSIVSFSKLIRDKSFIGYDLILFNARTLP